MNSENDENINTRNSKVVEVGIVDSINTAVMNNNERKNYEEFDDRIDSKVKKPSSISEIIDDIGYGWSQLLVVLLVGSFNILIACELTIFSYLLPVLGEKWDLTSFEVSLIGSVTFFGVFLGALFWGMMSDFLGRKDIIFVCSVVTLCSGCINSVCWNHYVFAFVEFVIGFHIGGGATLIWQYYVEFLPTKRRGFLLINMQFFWTVGVIFECLLSWIFLTKFEKYGWNFLVLFSAFPSILTIIIVPFLPRSPRFLIVRNKPHHLQTSIDWIEKTNKSIFCCIMSKNNLNSKKRKYDVSEIIKNAKKKSRDEKDATSFRVSELLNCRTLFMFISIVIFYICAYFGYYGVALSTPNFFSGEKNLQYLGTLLITLAEFPGVFSASIMLSIIGRKLTLVTYLLMSSLSLALLLLAGKILTNSFVLQVIFGFFARGSIIGASSTTWVLAQESLPTRTRSLGSGVGNGIGNLVTVFTPILANVFAQNNAFVPKIICGVVTCFAGLLCLFYPYESKGKELKDFS